ncbi:hypothetical protein AB6A40_006834 [Gnathostoma spinigerum]|uniref:Ribosomal protein L20 n=1 Tax=Gnathostoma spinigerum TaxID=75299 RepID=A0ABD6EKP6_9BILA
MQQSYSACQLWNWLVQKKELVFVELIQARNLAEKSWNDVRLFVGDSRYLLFVTKAIRQCRDKEDTSQ